MSMWKIGLPFLGVLTLLAGIAIGLGSGVQQTATPAPESLLPAKTAIYVAWDGNDAHRESWEQTAAYEALYESGLADLIKKVFVMIIRESGGDEADFLKVFDHVSAKGLSLSVSLPEPGGPPLPRSVVILHEAAPLEPVLARVLNRSVGREITFQSRKISGRDVTGARIPNSPGIEVGWWTEGKHLVFALGIDAASATISTATGQSPDITSSPLWSRYRKSSPDFEVSSVAWLDLRAIRQTYGEFPLPSPGRGVPPLNLNQILKTAGLEKSGALVYRSGYKGRAMVSETHCEAPAPRQGLLALADQPAITIADLPPLPAETTGFYARSVDWSKSYEAILATAGNVMQLMNPRGGAQVDGMVEMFNARLGVDLKRDLFGTLGNVVCVYSDTKHGFFGFGVGLAVEVEDAMSLRKTMETLLARLAASVGTTVNIRPVQKHDREIIVFEFSGFPLGPAFAIDDNWLVAGLSSQTVEAFLLRLDDKLPRWSPSAEHQEALATMPSEFTSLTVSDPRQTIGSLLSFAPMVIGSVQLGMNQSSRFSGKPPRRLTVTAADIPPTELVTQPLFPNVTVGTVDAEGLHWRSRQSLPSIPLLTGLGGGSGVAVPATLTALLLPAVQQAREAARRTQSRNNLKQIGLALHNYHDTHKGFPQGTHPKGDLKPEERLSWMAEILPYIEQAALHESIDFQKAWNDEANQTAMQVRIPIYQHPSRPLDTEAEHGTTHYVGISGVGKDAPTLPVTHKRAGFFGYNRVTRVRDIRDGTSNTIAVSEASEDFGPWGQGGKSTIRAFTQKPYINGPDGIGGPSPGGCNMLFGDGSVRFISENIDPQVLEALSTINGGEPVGDF